MLSLAPKGKRAGSVAVGLLPVTLRPGRVGGKLVLGAEG